MEKKRECKSEERTKTEYFSNEFMEKRYVNTRVEMELAEFKQDIERKFKKGEIKNFNFPRMELIKDMKTQQASSS